ncbi:hypothetical protein [Kordia jejudonensis]|uniref:hypothetical protein n=1 Tax=Kordia jejudonensis TaxID=1348245 RepID=UPI0006290881|nr:hypothetical protein [Kordia jejudonensis]
MKIRDIDLGFLWDRYIPILGATSPYELKWDNEIDKFDEYLQKEPIEKMLEAVVIAFKDQYPRALFLYGALSIGFYSQIVEEGEYRGLNQKDIKRNDILKYRHKLYTNPEDYEFIVEIILEYISTFNVVSFVENGLAGKLYTKIEQNGYTVFKVQDSPIAEISVSTTKFHLKINKEKLVYRAG